MGFLFPAVLGGLAAISIPIAIHLLNKLRVRVVDWAAMKFLADSLRKNERRVKLEDRLLLILRCLLIALLVFAFARPVLRELADRGADSSGPVAAVVLLDNSASMKQGTSVETRFDRAKKEIVHWLDERAEGSLVALYLVSNRTEAVIARPQADRALFRKMLEVAKPTDRGTDLVQGIRQAFQVLETVEGRNREIRVYSDDQTGGWMDMDSVRKLIEEHPDILVKSIPLGQPGESNLGIVGLRVEGGVPATGQPCRMRVEVGNYGEQPADGVVVSLSIDGVPAGEALSSAITPGTTQVMEMVVSFATPGPHVVTAKIPPDALAVDNERAAAVNAVRRMNVLIVEGGSPPETPTDRAGFFLANALVPLPPDRAAQYYLASSFTSVNAINAQALADVEAVFFVNPGVISTETAGLVRDYVASGGNVVIFPGTETNAGQWAKNSIWNDLLPVTLEPAQVAEEGKLLAWQSGDYEHPVTALWNNSSQGSLGSVKIAKYFPLKLKTSGETSPSVIVRMGNGEPAAVEWSFGQGKVAVFNSTATPEWSNLPLHPAFVALTQRLMGYLNREDQRRLLLTPGEPFIMSVNGDWRGREFFVQTPGRETSTVGGQVAFDEGSAYIRFANTETVGGYWIFVDKEPVEAFAVQLSPKESDLRQISSAELENLSKPSKAAAVATPPQLVVKREFWTPFIWIALAVAIAEAAFAHRFSLAR